MGSTITGENKCSTVNYSNHVRPPDITEGEELTYTAGNHQGAVGMLSCDHLYIRSMVQTDFLRKLLLPVGQMFIPADLHRVHEKLRTKQ